METATAALSALAWATSERWPACSAPIVGTRPRREGADGDAARARHSPTLRTTRGCAPPPPA
eukprot:3308591-Prymnesium_polylepis.1